MENKGPNISPMAILAIGGVVAVFVLGNKVFELLGLSKDQNDKSFDQYNENPFSFWQPGFYENGPVGMRLLTSETCEKMWADINAAFGWFDDDETAVISIFKNNIRTKSQLSFFAWYVATYKGVNLLQWLRGSGYPSDRLDTEEIREISNYAENLPSYF